MRTSPHKSPTLHLMFRIAGSLLLLSALAVPALAHCDSLDGPVVTAARTALETEDLTPVLKWVRSEDEARLREAFTLALAVRSQSSEAQALADRWFFETLVRVHREGEGFPFTGLQPAGAPIEPVILAADAALESGSAEGLTRRLTEAVEHGIHSRLQRALEAKAHAGESVEAGRRFVAAYVELTHYVEALDGLASGHGEAHGGLGSDHEHP